MKNISDIMGVHIYVITEKLCAINFLNEIDACRLVPGRFPDSPRGFDFFKQLNCTKSDGILCDTGGGANRCEMRRVLVFYFRMVYIRNSYEFLFIQKLIRG